MPCFGPDIKASLLEPANLPAVPDEALLLQAVRDKVGPYASEDKLLLHLRASRGKVHWAVNSYLRAVLASSPPPAVEDFDPKPVGNNPGLSSAGTHQQQATASPVPQDADLHSNNNPEPSNTTATLGARQCAGAAGGTELLCANQDSSCDPATATVTPVKLDALPINVLELVLSCLDLSSVLSASCSCQALHMAAQADGMWCRLFAERWGGTVFPINSSSNRTVSCSSAGSNISAASVGAAPAPGGAGSGWTDGAAAAASTTAAGRQHLHRAPVPHFAAGTALGTADGAAAQTSATAPQAAAATDGPGSHAHTQAAAGPQQPPGQQQHPQQQQPDNLVSRWTGSSCTSQHNIAAKVTGDFAAAANEADGVRSSRAAGEPCQDQRQQPQTGSQSLLGQQQDAAAIQLDQLPPAAPLGSWQQQFKHQYGYTASRMCPQCGVSTIVPIVYGFPSAALLHGMSFKRLVLGGDHLIESCHVWACGGCRSCFRFYPYCQVQLWLQDDAQQQRLDQRRASAAASSRQRGAAAGANPAAAAAGGGGAVGNIGQEQHAAGAGQSNGSAGGGEAFPRYTYEL